MNLDWNCHLIIYRNKQACQYSGDCRTSIVVYQAVCLKTNKCYIGNTQQHMKTRMQGHIQDVKNLFISDKSSDSFASHFASLIPEGTVKKNVKDFVKIKVDILWQGDPLSWSTNFWYQNLQTVCKGTVCYHQAHPHDSPLGYQQVQRGPWRLPPQAKIPQVRPLREFQLQH
jgi:hypothetical protein